MEEDLPVWSVRSSKDGEIFFRHLVEQADRTCLAAKEDRSLESDEVSTWIASGARMSRASNRDLE